MLKKYSVLLGVIVAVVFLVIATVKYPGGSQADKNSIGYSWKNNYISNLFGENAVNGEHNPGRYWAVTGMMFLSISFVLFFIDFSNKIPSKGAAKMIRYFGVISMICAFLIATPLHDTMITIASTMFLVGIFYITVFVLKSKLHLFKILCILCMLVFYCTIYIYGVGKYREYLPIMQKITFGMAIVTVISLHYFTGKEDFAHIKAGK